MKRKILALSFATVMLLSSSVSIYAADSTTSVQTATEQTLPTRGAIYGVITDSKTGLPVAGVTVLTPSMGQTVTDADGYYVLTGAAPTKRKLAIGVIYNGTTTYTTLNLNTTGNTEFNSTVITPVEAPALPDRGAIYGVITDSETGLPVAGVTVSTPNIGSTVTDENGYYVLTGATKNDRAFLMMVKYEEKTKYTRISLNKDGNTEFNSTVN